MSAASSERPEQGAPHLDDSAARVRAQLARADQQVAALEAEHDQLLSDPEVIQEDRDATAVLLEHARRQLADARVAVARLDDGSYGRCARCGADIGAERLAALVDVTTCVECAGSGS